MFNSGIVMLLELISQRSNHILHSWHQALYQYSKKLVTYKEYSCFDNSDFSAHSLFTFDVYRGSLGTSIFGNSSSAANNIWSRLPSRLSFRFLWLCAVSFVAKWSKRQGLKISISWQFSHIIFSLSLRIIHN